MLAVNDRIKFEDSNDIFVVKKQNNKFVVINERTEINELGFGISDLIKLSRILYYTKIN